MVGMIDTVWLFVSASLVIFIVMAIVVGRSVIAVYRHRAERRRAHHDVTLRREWEQIKDERQNGE